MSDKDSKNITADPSPTRDLTPFEEMDRLFQQLLAGGMLRPFDISRPSWMRMHEMDRMPRVDIIDRNGEILVKAEIPGIEKDNIDVSVNDNAITIKGEIREQREEQGELYRNEIHRSNFVRTVRLPCSVDGDGAKAKFKNGVLEITLPKTEPVKKVSVEIQ